jgi:hypothetical protein
LIPPRPSRQAGLFDLTHFRDFRWCEIEVKMLPTVENQKLKVQEPAIPVIVWVYILYVYFYERFLLLMLTRDLIAVG